MKKDAVRRRRLCNSRLPVEGDQAHDVDHQNAHGNHILEHGLHPILHLQALAGIGLGLEVLPAPAVALAAAEQRDDQRAQRQQVVGNDEVPQIQPCSALGKGLEGPQAVTQSSGHRGDGDADAADQTALGTVPAGELTDAGQNVLEHSQNRGHGSKDHEQEEDGGRHLRAVLEGGDDQIGGELAHTARDDDNGHAAESRCFSGSGKAAVDAADNGAEGHDDRNGGGQAFDAFLPRGVRLTGAHGGRDQAAKHAVAGEQTRGEKAGAENGHEHLTGGLVGENGVDDDEHRGRDDGGQTAGSRDGAGRHTGIIAGLLEFGDNRGSHGGGSGGGGAGKVTTTYVMLTESTTVTCTIGAGGVISTTDNTAPTGTDAGVNAVSTTHIAYGAKNAGNPSVGINDSSGRAYSGGNGASNGTGYGGGGGGACGGPYMPLNGPGNGGDNGGDAQRTFTSNASTLQSDGGDGGNGAIIIEYYLNA